VLGLGFIAIPIVLHRVFTQRNSPYWQVNIFLAVGAVISFVLTIQHARFGALAELFFVLALAQPLDVWLKKLAEYRTGLIGFMESTLIVIMLASVSFIIGTSLWLSREEARSERVQFGMDGTCEVKDFMNFLESDQRWPTDQKLIVGAHVNLGLRVVFHTRHQVVGTPYHRNGDAIYDTFTLMMTPDLAVARDIVRKRQMDMIIICDTRYLEGRTAAVDAPKHFFTDLAVGHIPPWLVPLDLSHIPDTGIRAFIVDKPALQADQPEHSP
jgi:hypothetical protein